MREGFHPVIIGRRDHVEVRGLTGDLEAFDVVLDGEDVANLQAHPRFGVVAQTTQPIDRVRHLVRLIRDCFSQSEVCFIDTVCQPTKLRQNAAVELAQHCDVVVVIGGAHSNNSNELVKTCSRFCARVHHVQTAADLHEKVFRAEDTIGITAGTSTPDSVIAEVEHRLKTMVRHAEATSKQPARTGHTSRSTLHFAGTDPSSDQSFVRFKERHQ